MKNKIRPRKLPAVRWTVAKPARPQPPTEMANFRGIAITIDDRKFAEFIEELRNGTAKDT